MTVAIQPTATHLPPAEYFRGVRYVTLKLTNGCNLKCAYCNVEADSPSVPKMRLATFEKVARLLIENSVFPMLGLEFHGGEPLLLPDSFYEQAVGFAKELAARHGKHVMHPLQTNGTLLTEERFEKLTGLGIQIGFSIDGPPAINDELRGAGKAVEKTIRAAVEKGRSFGTLLVLSRANCDRMTEVMDYFQGLGISNFRVNFLQPQGRGLTQDLLTPEQMFAGLKAVFDHMVATDAAVIEATTQMLVARFALGRDPTPALSCWEFQCQAGRIYCAVDHAGNVQACGTDMTNHRLGHIDAPFDRAHVAATLKRLHQKDDFFVRCFGCKARRICALSCPTSDANDTEYRERECAYTKMLYRYYAEREDDVLRLHARLRQLRPDFAL
jgi:uncharacterized protein